MTSKRPPTYDTRTVPAKEPKHWDTPLPHTLPAHLPTPGKAPDWPYINIGKWKIDVNNYADSWRKELTIWRHEHKIRAGYDGSRYDREDLAWSQRNFVHTQMMVEDRYFYDPVKGEYTVDRYLDDLERRFGGIDSVLIWYVYPNIGIDNRNQTMLASDMPGGLEGLKKAVEAFQKRGVRVFLPTMPWDNGTRPEGKEDWEAVTDLAVKLNADGVNGDTYNGVPRVYADCADKAKQPLIFQPEGSLTADEALQWNQQTWGKASTETIPAVSKVKWLESRHMVNLENRWCRDRTDDFHYMFFNGVGYTAWENVWGIWNQFTDRDGEALRRISTIYRQFPEQLVSPGWEPYVTALQQNVFASRFPANGVTLWTIVNRNEYEVNGEQLIVPHTEGRQYYDVWNGVPIAPRIQGEGEAATASFDLTLEVKGFGAIVGVDKGMAVQGMDAFLKKMAGMAAQPLRSFSGAWKPLPQKMIDIAPTKPAAAAPEGMVAIPAGTFDFVVTGIEVEGYTWAGMDFQYPWESIARRAHRRRMDMKPFYIDKYNVTNAQFKAFLDASGYKPRDAHNFLKDWDNGAPRKGWENKPVTWVGLEDARAYAAWAGKRLPHEWEWQYAAQGTDGRLYPWGDQWNDAAAPAKNKGRELLPPADVDAHPQGASPFGVMDLVGNVWQWTSEFEDEHTRAAALRGGSSYFPQTSHWYFPQAHRLDQHGKYLLMAPAKDRSGMLGFRCVVDAA
ncbi:formylglycine-generating enzyme family protein [Massilia endophytica]|uniref:formylglycine-generating enzyme family protein n=1 Tax=Massilia endophytica TaxID=2899220 RepID=UPI001E500A87|nr:SUMF1/EgtB/PvdO family nonheme iron enzyme [Massilia endophytica]UGQ46722.1 formylglycine-generating enzyme family protein [Massilia endophytica]